MPHHLQPPPPLDPADWEVIGEGPVSVIPPAQARAVLDEAGIDTAVMDGALRLARVQDLVRVATVSVDRVSLALAEATAATVGAATALAQLRATLDDGPTS